jgi:hypothetical protein
MSKNKNDTLLRIILIVVLVLVAVALSISYRATLKKEKIDNVNVDGNFEEDYLRQNCECISRDNFACQFDGFVYEEGYCRKNNTMVNPIRKCSKYECDGEIVIIPQQDILN